MLHIEYERFLHAFRLVHPQRFSHTIHAFSDEYICIYSREKKIDGSCQRSVSSSARVTQTTRGEIDFCGDQTSSNNSVAKVFARHRAKSRGRNEGRLKIYAIFLNSFRERKSRIKAYKSTGGREKLRAHVQ